MNVTAIADGDALFLDFDGTLAALQDDPDAVRLDGELAGLLEALAARLDGAVAIVSGRDARDLASRTPPSLWRVGGHGLERVPPGAAPAAAPAAAPLALEAALSAIADGAPGARLERKGPILAVHYRAAPAYETVILRAVKGAAAGCPDYVVQPGKMVVEAKPVAANKGAAVRRLLTHAPFAGRRPIMAGDDATDEDAFAVVLEAGGVAVKVGNGASLARERLRSPDDVRAWIAEGARI